MGKLKASVHLEALHPNLMAHRLEAAVWPLHLKVKIFLNIWSTVWWKGTLGLNCILKGQIILPSWKIKQKTVLNKYNECAHCLPSRLQHQTVYLAEWFFPLSILGGELSNPDTSQQVSVSTKPKPLLTWIKIWGLHHTMTSDSAYSTSESNE